MNDVHGARASGPSNSVNYLGHSKMSVDDDDDDKVRQRRPPSPPHPPTVTRPYAPDMFSSVVIWYEGSSRGLYYQPGLTTALSPRLIHPPRTLVP